MLMYFCFFFLPGLAALPHSLSLRTGLCWGWVWRGGMLHGFSYAADTGIYFCSRFKTRAGVPEVDPRLLAIID